MEGYIIDMIYKLYSYNDFKWKGHISFINNMKYTEIKHICDDIYNEVEAHMWSDAMKLDGKNTDEVFRNAVIFHGLSSMSVRVNMGMTEVTQPDQERICIYKLDSMTYPEFVQIYYKLQGKDNINFDATLSEACPQYFYWGGL